jgi:hypothetical protein
VDEFSERFHRGLEEAKLLAPSPKREIEIAEYSRLLEMWGKHLATDPSNTTINPRLQVEMAKKLASIGEKKLAIKLLDRQEQVFPGSTRLYRRALGLIGNTNAAVTMPESQVINNDNIISSEPIIQKSIAQILINTTKGTIVGLIFGIYLFLASTKGAEIAYPVADSNEWTLLVWGDHWIIRIIFSSLVTFTSAIISGISIESKSKHLVSILLGLSNSLPFIFMVFSTFKYGFSHEITHTTWTILISIILLSYPSAWLGIELGIFYRSSNSKYFGNISKPLGIAWYHYPWVLAIAYYFIIELALSFIWFSHFVVADNLPLLNRLSGGLIAFGLYIFYLGLTRGLSVLIKGKQDGLSIKSRILNLSFYFIGFPVAANLVRGIGSYINSNIALPIWLRWLF